MKKKTSVWHGRMRIFSSKKKSETMAVVIARWSDGGDFRTCQATRSEISKCFSSTSEATIRKGSLVKYIHKLLQ